MSIASRQAGAVVPCPMCGRDTVVPHEDEPPAAEQALAKEPQAQPAQPAGAAPEAATDRPPSEQAEGESPRREASPPDRFQPHGEPEAGHEADRPHVEERFVLRKVGKDFGGEMDLTPMVDVTFLLLIFFMVTASFSLQKSIEVPSPDPDQEGATQSIQSPEDLQENAVIVRIDERNAISVDYEPVAASENLAELLLDRRRRQQKSELVIDAASAASHGTVVMVNDAAIEADFQRIRLAVRSEGAE